ncbi:MAG: cytochrome c biogenesis protein CcsA [Magnetococcales bacterium]|nr:cytochrome c biogenesis protein CcsA [Magnetococcales bacterium]
MLARWGKIEIWLGAVTLILLGAGLWLAMTAPADFQQGYSVRILYVHVPSAKMALLSYLFLTGCSIVVLWKKSETADVLAQASVSVGAAFSVVTLASGAIWGKPMWGVWWAWDARLTSMLVLLIIYVGLMGLRSALDPGKAAKATAVMAIIGAVDLPIIHYSVTMWRTLHQPASFSKTAGISIAGPLLIPLVVMAVAFICLGAYMVLVKARAIEYERRIEALELAEEMGHEEMHHG